MSENQPFIRQIEVLVGPLEEWRGGGNEKQAVRFYGDGSANTLRIKFNVQKHVISTATPSIVQIYNLSQALRDSLRKPGIKVVLRAGWKNTGLVQVFTGSLLAVVNNREGADIVTNLISLAGWGGMSRSVISKTYGKLTSVRDIVLGLAREIPGVSVDPKMVDIKDAAVGIGGWSFAGAANEGLDKLARVYGFSWWVNNGMFYAVDDTKALGSGRVLISAENGYLLRAEPMLASPMQIQAGVSIQSLFNPFIEPGRLVELKSELNPKLNRSYRVHTLNHSGDTHSTQWTSSVDSWIVM